MCTECLTIAGQRKHATGNETSAEDEEGHNNHGRKEWMQQYIEISLKETGNADIF